MDHRELHPLRRSSLSRHPAAFGLHRGDLDFALCRPRISARAFHLSRREAEDLYLQLVLLPFWTSFLVRTYAWLFILRDTGLINTVLIRVIITTPFRCSTTTARYLLDSSTGFCHSWYFRCTRLSNGSIPHCSMPRRISERALCNALCELFFRFRHQDSSPDRFWYLCHASAPT